MARTRRSGREPNTAPEDATDLVRWIDTDVMVADPLTKTMEPVKLAEILDTSASTY